MSAKKVYILEPTSRLESFLTEVDAADDGAPSNNLTNIALLEKCPYEGVKEMLNLVKEPFYNAKNEFVYKSRKINNTNMVQMLEFLFNPKLAYENAKVEHINLLLKFLQDIKLPSKFVQNHKARMFISRGPLIN